MVNKKFGIVLRNLAISYSDILVKAFWISLFAVFTAIGARIEIWNTPVPYTLQTLFVLLAGAILGKSSGFLSMILYITLGVIGLPVFSSGSFGLAKIFGPTGGYILAFPISAFIVGYLVQFRKHYLWIVFSMLLGSITYFLIGTIHLNLFYIHNWSQSFQLGFLIFSIWDMAKIIAAASIAHYYLNHISSRFK